MYQRYAVELGKYAYNFLAGALETLAHFLEQLKLCDATANVQNINTEIAGIFDRLTDLDSHRRQRYQDASKSYQ